MNRRIDMGIEKGAKIKDYDYEDVLSAALQHLKEKLMAKHYSYGSNNLKKHGLVGINVRLDDKMARANNFFENTSEYKVDDETLVDTYEDIAGYGIQAILLHQGKL
jgi:hypothetical protein